ncbi:sigma 54-interacting transcriptional regulator [Desulfuromonas sp. KJ2020]|uniref:sigma-54 interaction domain-containing protein n=1 Tax=Desulfuromonas sp. KJ2020 TaxID=2919173 RepID=UPI0020A7A719|nr:sigma 54-interacting transcriptional regulator [Desulfuromonas sp. KJ2020]MCP3177020.1 sigma 54-interacting transcriptional regulator [Desulfuromonas sp. KJ2020]
MKTGFSPDIFEQIVAHMVEGVIFLDGEDTIRVCNPAAERIRGVRADRIIGKSILSIHPANMHHRIRELIANLKSGRYAAVNRSIQVKNRFFDNSYSGIRNPEGQYIGTLLISRDITESKLLAEQNHQLRHSLLDTGNDGPLVAQSRGMQHVVEMVQAVAGIDSTVLIVGESGTGKERIVDLLHRLSPRLQRPLIRVNCAALPENLIESELFGHQRGAFTGAVDHAKGKFVQADGGTLFLDEIGELPLTAQAKMLRAIQSRAVQPLGSDREIQVNVRIVAATNRNLAQEVQEGRFREDLYYRLNVITMEVPPLRDRYEDILPLTEIFVQQLARQMGKPVPIVSAELRTFLAGHPLPGNVRQLKHALERAVALNRTGTLTVADLPPDLQSAGRIDCNTLLAGDQALKEALGNFERAYIVRALETHQGRKTATAESLGISRKGLWEKMQRYGILEASP